MRIKETDNKETIKEYTFNLVQKQNKIIKENKSIFSLKDYTFKGLCLLVFDIKYIN